MRLLDYLNAVDRRIDAAVARDTFHPTQRELLKRAVQWYRPVFAADPASNPIALLYFVARAWGRDIDGQVECAGAFCSLYLLSADLLDDVQDGELESKSHAATSPAIAVNNAVTLLFLGLEELERCAELERRSEQRDEFWRLFNRVSVDAVAGQHRDLQGRTTEMTPEVVLMMAQAKTSSVAMIAECAALLARCESELVVRYRHAGESLATLVQIRDDLVDIFGKRTSPDLAAEKATFPIACFYQAATSAEREQFDQLVRRLPDSIHEIRRLVYDSGTVVTCAERMEELREAVHRDISATCNCSAYHRILLDLVDRIAGSVYQTPAIALTTNVRASRGTWHDRIGEELSKCLTRVNHREQLTRPNLQPWHLPQWMYVPDRCTIYYPDIAGLAEEVLPFQAQLIGVDDLGRVAELMSEQLPAVVVHEAFHWLRHVSGHLSADQWFEEWAANRLAVAYLQKYEPAVLVRSLQLAESILVRHARLLDQRAERVLGRCFERGADERAGYDMDTTSMAIVSLEMIRRLAAQPIDLDAAVRELLEGETSRPHESAA